MFRLQAAYYKWLLNLHVGYVRKALVSLSYISVALNYILLRNNSPDCFVCLNHIVSWIIQITKYNLSNYFKNIFTQLLKAIIEQHSHKFFIVIIF